MLPDRKFCRICGARLDEGYQTPLDASPSENREADAPPRDNQEADAPPRNAPEGNRTSPPSRQPAEQDVPARQSINGSESKTKTAGKRKKWPLILGAIAVCVIVAIAASSISLRNTANADYYTMGSDRIPSIKLVVGHRAVRSAESNTSGGVSTRRIAYSDTGEPTADLSAYIRHLMEEEEFGLTMEYNPGAIPGSTQLAKASIDDGQVLILDIAYDARAYTLSFTKGEGTYTLH